MYNTFTGYKFDRKFSTDEINSVWNEIKFHRRISTILISFVFLFVLYEIIFPKFSFLVNNNSLANVLYILLLITIVCQIITVIFAKLFEKKLKKKFGSYTNVKYISSGVTDENFYRLFKIELAKALTLVFLIVTIFAIISPFAFTRELLKKERFNDVIKLTTFGSKIFPIASDWYSMRGYAKYKTGDYQGAIKDFDKAYELSANGFDIMNFDNKIFIKYYIKDYDSALQDFDNEIKKAQNDNEKDQFLWDKAQFLYNIKKYEDAMDIYNQLLIQSDNDRIYLLKDRLYLERAQVYKDLGQDELAKLDIESSGISDSDDNSIAENPIPKPTLMVDDETIESF
ncbi:tetratricopeptide repeat protein [bacterium]|nr:tetratricopeptide repeat protein [bacterium]